MFVQIYRRAMLVLLLALLSVSQATWAEKKPAEYLGDRLINLVGNDPKVSPLPGDIKKALPECTFALDDDSLTYTYAIGCHVKKASALLSPSDQKGVNIIASTPRCCLIGVLISQTVLDPSGAGMRLFDGLKGVTAKPLQCSPDDEGKIYLIEKNGKPKFIAVEYVSSGSAGTTVDTHIDFGKIDLNCATVFKRDDIYAAERKFIQQRTASKPVEGPKNENNSVYDEKTGVRIRLDSLPAKEGACLAYLSRGKQISPDTYDKRMNGFNPQQKQWMQKNYARLKYWAEFSRKMPDLNLFDIQKRGLEKPQEIEWYAGFLTASGGLEKIEKRDIARLELGYISVCGDAKLIDKF